MIPLVDLNSFRYELPKERIAQYPVSPRDQSKLLVSDERGEITEQRFYQLSDHVPSGALMVFNQTKVIPARLLFQTETGAQIELFCLEPVGGMDQLQALSSIGQVHWKCLIGNAKRWKGQVLQLTIAGDEGVIVLSATLQEKGDQGSIVLFEWTPSGMTWIDVLERAGKMPLPPYMKRETSVEDEERYQTVYAKVQGSVAAPTAGLHFTEGVLDSLQQKNVRLLHTTLHVGAGTFKPIKSSSIEEHDMHAEELIVERDLVEVLALHQEKIIAVGTTSVRCLESLYWMGVKVSQGGNTVEALNVLQWEAYNLSTSMSFREAMTSLNTWMKANELDQMSVKTSIIIVPGYLFRGVDFLITNFHQPESTLMLLVGAFLGENWKKVYQFALKNDFRFLSYGDSSFLARNCG